MPAAPARTVSLPMLLAILAVGLVTGALLAAQPAINGALARELGSPTGAALVSLLVSTLLVLPFVLLGSGGALAAGVENAAAGPWWLWVGGLSGAVFVVAGLLLAPLIGVALFLSSVVAGQLLAAMAIDHYGLFGVTVHAIDPVRVIGIALVFAGVVVYRFAPG